jgi:hypothetical protein
VGYSGKLAVIPFPDELETVQRLNVEPPIPFDFYERRVAFRTKAVSAWEDLGRYIEARYSKYADF